MKKKILSVTLSLCLVVASMFLLAACDKQKFDTTLIKVGETEFTYDGDSHICEIDYEAKDIDLTVTYSTTKDGEFKSASDLSFVNAGTYSVYYKLSAEGYVDFVSENPVEIKINAKNIADNVIALGQTSFVYNGSAQIFSVHYNGSETATVTYSLTQNGEYKPASAFNFVNVGTYNLYYKVSVNNNYVDFVSATPVQFTINAKAIDASKISVGQTSFVYNGSAQIFDVNYSGTEQATVTYSLTQNGEYKPANEFNFVDADTYSLYYKVSIANHADYISATPVEFTINENSISASKVSVGQTK